MSWHSCLCWVPHGGRAKVATLSFAKKPLTNQLLPSLHERQAVGHTHESAELSLVVFTSGVWYGPFP